MSGRGNVHGGMSDTHPIHSPVSSLCELVAASNNAVGQIATLNLRSQYVSCSGRHFISASAPCNAVHRQRLVVKLS